jgi:hypothetical protein
LTSAVHRCLLQFYAFSKRVCSLLRSLPPSSPSSPAIWADLVDPCTGYPTLGPHGSGIYNEVDSASMLLNYRMEQVGSCSMIDHPKWSFSQYPATCLTTATVEQTLQAIQQTLNEFGLEELKETEQ